MKKGFFLTFLIVALIFLVHCSNLPVSVYFERNDVAAVKAKENIPRRIEEEVEEIVEVINNSLLVKGSGRFEKGLVAIEGANFTKFVAVDGAGSINGNLLVGGKVDIGGMLIVEEDVVSKDVNLTQLV